MARVATSPHTAAVKTAIAAGLAGLTCLALTACAKPAAFGSNASPPTAAPTLPPLIQAATDYRPAVHTFLLAMAADSPRTNAAGASHDVKALQAAIDDELGAYTAFDSVILGVAGEVGPGQAITDLTALLKANGDLEGELQVIRADPSTGWGAYSAAQQAQTDALNRVADDLSLPGGYTNSTPVPTPGT
jgi:hypothetical protein